MNLLFIDKTIKLWKVSERDKRVEGYNTKEENGQLRDPACVTALRVSCFHAHLMMLCNKCNLVKNKFFSIFTSCSSLHHKHAKVVCACYRNGCMELSRFSQYHVSCNCTCNLCTLFVCCEIKNSPHLVHVLISYIQKKTEFLSA